MLSKAHVQESKWSFSQNGYAFALCDHGMLLTQMPREPWCFIHLVDAASKGKGGRKLKSHWKKKTKTKKKIKIKWDAPKVCKWRRTEAHGEKPFVALRIGSVIAWTIWLQHMRRRELKILSKRSLCWRSWSAAISQINRQDENSLKEINYKTPKETVRALKRKDR